jgi:hypothetical protein
MTRHCINNRRSPSAQVILKAFAYGQKFIMAERKLPVLKSVFVENGVQIDLLVGGVTSQENLLRCVAIRFVFGRDRQARILDRDSSKSVGG